MPIGDRISTDYDDFTWPANDTGLEFYDLSIPWGHGVANWPYFEDPVIERVHYMAKSRVLTQKITTVMHSTTHVDVPAHVIENTPFLDEVPLHCFFGTGVVVSIPKGKWEKIMPEDLEAAEPAIQPGDIVIVNTGWHHTYGDNSAYYAYSPGFYEEAGEWFAEKGVKAVGTDTQALDHPLATAIAPHGPGAPGTARGGGHRLGPRTARERRDRRPPAGGCRAGKGTTRTPGRARPVRSRSWRRSTSSLSPGFPQRPFGPRSSG